VGRTVRAARWQYVGGYSRRQHEARQSPLTVTGGLSTHPMNYPATCPTGKPYQPDGIRTMAMRTAKPCGG
jgi:hypothetical protein